MDARGNFRFIAHSQGFRNICGSTDSQVSRNASYGCAVHFFAEHPAGPWTPSLEPVVTNHTALVNGSEISLFTRQRNQIIFDEDVLYCIVYLSCLFALRS
jgi:hypothetical protein